MSARAIHGAIGAPAGVPNEPKVRALRPSKTSQQGRQYCAIAGASKLPKGMKAPATTINDTIYYEIEEGEGGQFNDMPEWLQEKIRASKEFATAAGKPTAIKSELDADGNQVPF